MLTLSKLELAEHQLERALELFLDQDDLICAITLAGASEELLGKLLKQHGKQHALGNFIELCISIDGAVHKEELPEKAFVNMANSFRDGLKHITDGESFTIPREAAVEILDRAVENFRTFTGRESANMRRFMETEHGL